MDDLELHSIRVVEEHRVIPRRVGVILRVALDLGSVRAQPVGALVDDAARDRFEGEMVETDRIAVVRARRLRLAQADLRLVADQVPDRLAALALDLADPVPAERTEELAVERQAPLDRGDDEIDMMDAAGTHEIQRNFGTQGSSPRTIAAPVHLFHYHLVTSRVREVEARYIGKLGFDLIARHGRIGDDLTSYEPGVSWAELDALGFKLRLSEIELGAVNVVVQPGQWPLPRVDHLGLALDEDEFDATLERAQDAELRVQEHGGRRTFVSTNAGYRLELHPPRDWIDELLMRGDRLQLAQLHLRADDPYAKARALAELLDCDRDGGDVEVGDTLVRFVPGGPQGRPELHGEAFV